MESYDSRVIINNSQIDGKDILEDERRSSISALPCSHNGPFSNEEIFCNERTFASRKPFAMPNELYIRLNSESCEPSNMRTKTERLEFFSIGCQSTPASPDEAERTRGKQTKKDSSVFHSPAIEKKMPFSFSTSFVRTSKSEDHLQKSSLTTVNIDIEDELASSLDTLLDTKADEVYNEIGDEDCLSTSCPEVMGSRTRSPDEPHSGDASRSSSETASPSKNSVKVAGGQNARQDRSDPLSESSGSEMIPSESSTTIRRDSDECECTSEQISAISSLDDATDLSRATDSDLGTPDGSLSPGSEVNMEDDWVKDVDKKDGVAEVFQDIAQKSKVINKTARQQVPTSIELGVPDVVPRQQLSLPVAGSAADKSPSKSSCSLPVPKPPEEQLQDVSGDSPTSPCSEDTYGDVSYQELTESYDDASLAIEAEDVVFEAPPMPRPESPPTDDESDIESLHSFHYSPKAVDIPSAIRLAKRLYGLEGFKKTDVSRHLSKNNEFSRAVAEEYLKFFDFPNCSLDIALRKFLSQFCLIGETQERERVLLHFSKRYLDCNPNSFKSQDAVHTLTCALMLLNSDLHGENVRRKMVCGEFIENLSELNDGENFPRDILKALYHSIKNHPLEWAEDQDVKKNNSKEKSNSFIGHNPFLEVPNPNCATEYKKGYVMRKCCIDPSGKKTPLGKRSWKMLYATLRDLVLYLHKDEHGFKKNQLYDSLHNSIRIHHAFAEKAVDYTKKQFVFRLHTADHAVYLFQTSDSKELESWVDTINLVAASLSSPPLPSGVGCQKKFQRPLMPVSHTKLNLREQLQDHETRIVWLEKEYEELLCRTPEKNSKSRFAQEYAEKEVHLRNELMRYRTYAFLLRTRMAQYPELETPLVQTTIGELEEPTERGASPTSPSNSPAKKAPNATVAVVETHSSPTKTT